MKSVLALVSTRNSAEQFLAVRDGRPLEITNSFGEDAPRFRYFRETVQNLDGCKRNKNAWFPHIKERLKSIQIPLLSFDSQLQVRLNAILVVGDQAFTDKAPASGAPSFESPSLQEWRRAASPLPIAPTTPMFTERAGATLRFLVQRSVRLQFSHFFQLIRQRTRLAAS